MADNTSPLSVHEQVADISKRLFASESERTADALPLREEVAEQDPAEAASESPAEEDIRTLADLAGALGVDPESLYDLEFTLAGTGESLKLGQVKDRLQSVQKLQDEAKAEREQLQQERLNWQNQAQQWLNQQQQTTAEFDQARMAVLQANADIERVDWDAFEKSDPVRAAQEYNKMMRRQQAAQAQFQHVQQTVQQQQWAAQQTWQQQQQQYRADQDAQLLDHVPDWRDPAKQQAELEGIWKWNQEKYGFTPEELGTAVDWRHRDMIRKAYLYDTLMGKKETLEKTPKTGLKASLVQKASSSERIDALKAKAIQTRAPSDRLAAAKAILEKASVKR